MKSLLPTCCLIATFLGTSFALGEPTETPLIAGKTWPVGTVYTWNDETHLFMQLELEPFVAEDGWCLKSANLHIGDSLDDFPLNKGGNPKVGHFAYALDLSCAALTEPIAIELGELAESPTLLLALHAEIELAECEDLGDGQVDCITYTEGVWAEGTPFRNKRSWAMYFDHEMETVSDDPESCCDLVFDIMSFDPMAMVPVPTISTYSITICDNTAIAATGPDSQTVDGLTYDPATRTVSFTVTYPDTSTWSPSFILMDDGTLLTENMQMTGFWNWTNCTE